MHMPVSHAFAAVVVNASGPLYGLLPASGNGEAKERVHVGCEDLLKQDCKRNKVELIRTLKSDVFEEELHQLTCEDAKLGRMTQPVPADTCDLEGTWLHPWCVGSTLGTGASIMLFGACVQVCC